MCNNRYQALQYVKQTTRYCLLIYFEPILYLNLIIASLYLDNMILKTRNSKLNIFLIYNNIYSEVT